MPNWCSNRVIIKGKEREIQELDERFRGRYKKTEGETTTIPEADLVEYVEALKGDKTILGYRVDTADMEHFFISRDKPMVNIHTVKEAGECAGYSFANIVPIEKEGYLKYGWYTWNVNNWGTKWDVAKESIGVGDVDGGKCYNFSTAWTPAVPIVAEMARQFPGLTIVHQYDEPGCCCAGVIRYKDGQVEEQEYTMDDDSDRRSYRQFCKEELGYTYTKQCKECSEWLEEDEEECPCGEVQREVE